MPFVEKNITKDEAAFRELTEDLELMTTPVIQVEDETLVGFNQKRLLELLGLKSTTLQKYSDGLPVMYEY